MKSIKHDLNYYKNVAKASIIYYKNVINEFKNDSFYLPLYIAMQFQKIIENPVDKNEVECFYKALKAGLDNQGTQWDHMFINFENWKKKYFDEK